MDNEKAVNGVMAETNMHEIPAMTDPDSDVMSVRIVADMSPEQIQKEKRKIMKNVLLISLAFLMNFNAYQGLARLQSSLHR